MRTRTTLAILNTSLLLLYGCLSPIATVSASGTGDILFAGETMASNDNAKTSGLQITTRVLKDSGNGYLSFSFCDSEGRPVDVNPASVAKTANKFRSAENLPASYRLSDVGLDTSIKDQGITGACWAFAAIKAAESNCILNNYSSLAETDFSENHLCWFSFYPDMQTSSSIYNDGFYLTNATNPSMVYDCGGNALMAITTLASWTGVESEAASPFQANTKNEQMQMTNSMLSNGEALRHNSLAHLQNAYCYDNASISEIKQALIDNGAIDIAMYYTQTGFESTDLTACSYYQQEYRGELAKAASNHCVTIVGWDDSYSKDNFRNTPAGDGAWLIANSYGTEYNQNGYFWLSYYEPSINEIYSLQMEPANNYDNIYQYDGGGFNSQISLTNADITGANVYTASKTYNQTLDAVSFYTLTDAQSYTIKIYRHLSGNAPSSGSLISQSTTTGSASRSGYHTVKLNTPCNLSAGEKFAVSITYHYNSLSGVQAYLPCEGRSQDYASTGISFRAASKKHQSYTYLNGAWQDMTDISDMNNLCIKAFTRNASKPITALSGSKNQTITLGKGETYGISLGSNIAKTNDSYVASVSSNGKITAVNTGKTVIGIAGNGDDEYSSTITVTVKKAPTKISVSPSSKTLKKGKSFTIKPKLPSNSASRKITFTSSKPKVAKVTAAGKVTAKKKGKAVITIKTYNNKKAKVTVKVK